MVWGNSRMTLINYSPWSGLIFCDIITAMDLRICNLILATIVRVAEETRTDDVLFIYCSYTERPRRTATNTVT